MRGRRSSYLCSSMEMISRGLEKIWVLVFKKEMAGSVDKVK